MQEDQPISVMKLDQASTAYIPMRIRDIIQETLSPNMWGQPLLAATLSKENCKLLTELDKAQSLLCESRKECNELGLKFISVSEKVLNRGWRKKSKLILDEGYGEEGSEGGREWREGREGREGLMISFYDL